MKVEQQFKLRQIEDALRNPETKKDDIITVFLALQRQCFVLGNNVSNLVSKWPTVIKADLATTEEEIFKSGTSSEIKN
jgi:superfamily I DNA and RNA helicase